MLCDGPSCGASLPHKQNDAGDVVVSELQCLCD